MRRTKPAIHALDFRYDPGFLLEDGSSGFQEVAISFTNRKLTQELRHPAGYAGTKDLNYEYPLSTELMEQITNLINEMDTSWWPKGMKKCYPQPGVDSWQLRITYGFDEYIEWEDKVAAPEQLSRLQQVLNDQLQPSYPIVLVEKVQPTLEVIRQAEADIPIHAARRDQNWKITDEVIEGFTPRIKQRLGVEFENDREEERFDHRAEMALMYMCILGLDVAQWDEVGVAHFGRRMIPELVQDYHFRANDLAEFFSCYLTLLVEDQKLTPRKAEKLRQAFCTGILSYYKSMEDWMKEGWGLMENLNPLLLTYRFEREA